MCCGTVGMARGPNKKERKAEAPSRYHAMGPLAKRAALQGPPPAGTAPGRASRVPFEKGGRARRSERKIKERTPCVRSFFKPFSAKGLGSVPVFLGTLDQTVILLLGFLSSQLIHAFRLLREGAGQGSVTDFSLDEVFVVGLSEPCCPAGRGSCPLPSGEDRSGTDASNRPPQRALISSWLLPMPPLMPCVDRREHSR